MLILEGVVEVCDVELFGDGIMLFCFCVYFVEVDFFRFEVLDVVGCGWVDVVLVIVLCVFCVEYDFVDWFVF